MPRLPSSLILRARTTNPLLVPLLKTCRDLPSATNELRWITEHVKKSVASRRSPLDRVASQNIQTHLIKKLCIERGQGKPLQYLLGTEYFGDLELACKPGVLIPRFETADIASELIAGLKTAIVSGVISSRLRILDLCTGTGCLALLLHTELKELCAARILRISTLGVDISQRAIQTALMNKRRLGLSNDPTINFIQADILRSNPKYNTSVGSPRTKRIRGLEDVLYNRPDSRQWDIVIANPPYISSKVFKTTNVEKSVRLFEPRAALVPPGQHHNINLGQQLDPTADLFYPCILDVAAQVNAKVVLMEVGEEQQALRVKREAEGRLTWDRIGIWKDGISSGMDTRGRQDRAVICSRAEGNKWVRDGRAKKECENI